VQREDPRDPLQDVLLDHGQGAAGQLLLSGAGGHTSRPHLTQDLVFAMAQIAINVPAILSRRIDVRVPDDLVEQLSGLVPGFGVEAAHGPRQGALRGDGVGGHARSDLAPDPPVVNGELETTMIENAARAELGEDAVVLVEQSMGPCWP
jgi:hypothetical protein